MPDLPARLVAGARLASLALLICSPGAPSGAADTMQASGTMRSRVTVSSWDDGGEISRWAYLHASEIFPAAIVGRSGPVRELRERPNAGIGQLLVSVGDEPRQTLDELVGAGAVDGLIVLRGGEVVYERYPHMRPADRHLVFSVTKAFVGVLTGILEDQRKLDLSRPIEAYLPEMKGTAWAGTTLRDIADMASGIDGGEDAPDAYLNPKYPIFQMEASLGWQPLDGVSPVVAAGDTEGFLRSMKRLRPPGIEWEYVSANTLMLAAVIERIERRPLAEVLSSEIWGRIGADGDALLLVNKKGFPIAHAGMTMSLRDLARFGLLFTPSGRAGGQPVVSARYLRSLLYEGRPQLLRRPHPSWVHHASYQWDEISPDGLIVKGGFGGQMLFIDAKRDVVIAMFGTNAAAGVAQAPILPHTLSAQVDALYASEGRPITAAEPGFPGRR